MNDRRVCPSCKKPIWEDATKAEREADPPSICSPIRCDMWTKKLLSRSRLDPATGRKTKLRVIDGGAA